jgi:ABC-type arginine transport system permease subunit
VILHYIVFGILFLGGFVLLGIAPGLPAWQGPVFVAGILAISLALAYMMREPGGAASAAAPGRTEPAAAHPAQGFGCAAKNRQIVPVASSACDG